MKTKSTTPNNSLTKSSQLHWLAAVVFLCASAGWSHAQSAYTWNGGSGTTGNWSDGANWGGSGPASPQAFLNFNGAARTSSTNDFSGGSAGYQIYFKSGANTFNLYGSSITFYDFGGGDPNIQNEGAFTNQIISFPIVNGNTHGANGILNINLNTGTAQGPLVFNGSISAADATIAARAINVSGSNTVTFNGVISDFSSSGKIALTQLGTGTTTLFATNLFTGGLTISAGTVALGDSGLLGNGSYAGAIGNSGAFVVNSTNAQTLSGNITGAGTLTKNGTNILTLAGANTYSGLTTNTGGTILYNGAGGNSGNGPYGLSTGSSLTLNSSGTVSASAIWLTRNSAAADPVINLQSGTLTVGSGGITNFVGTTGNAVINLGGGTLKSAATFNIANAIVINITNSSTIDTTGGNITNASSFVAGAANNGTLTIQGGNSLTAQDNRSGSTIITGNSTLRQLAASSPTGTLTVNTGSTLDLNTFALGIGALAGSGTIDTVAGGTPTLTVGSVNGNSLFSGLIKNTAGTLALTVTNPSATLTLSGANNTFGGTVNFRSGVIRAAATQTLGTGAVTVGNGGNESTGRLELSNSISLNNYINLSQRNNGSVSIENVSGNNNLTGTIGLTTGGSIAIIQSDAGLLTLGAASSTIISNQIAASTRIVTLSGAGNGTVAGNIIDSGSAVMALTKDGAGTWTLNGADTFSGDTRITNGTLTLGNTLAL